jgi:hypothetical protein
LSTPAVGPNANLGAVRTAVFVGSAIAIAACSGATSSVITQASGDGGTGADGSHGGSDGAGGDDGSSGSSGSSSGGGVGGDGAVSHLDSGDNDTGAVCHPSPPDGGACNALAPPPPNVTIQCNTAELVPAPTGGPITDGLYVLTSATYYAGGSTCPTPEVDGVTWLICGPSWQIAQTTALGGQTPTKLVANATVAAAGADLVFTLTCGISSTPITFGYDATPTTLRLHINGTSPNGRIDVFTRQ